MLVACGTVSSNCLGEVEATAGVPVIGVVKPAAAGSRGGDEKRKNRRALHGGHHAQRGPSCASCSALAGAGGDELGQPAAGAAGRGGPGGPGRRRGRLGSGESLREVRAAEWIPSSWAAPTSPALGGDSRLHGQGA